jgi:hypothetical protein
MQIATVGEEQPAQRFLQPHTPSHRHYPYIAVISCPCDFCDMQQGLEHSSLLHSLFNDALSHYYGGMQPISTTILTLKYFNKDILTLSFNLYTRQTTGHQTTKEPSLILEKDINIGYSSFT